ncbi:MAG: aldehyde dehydrogenase family protein [Desulfurivibrio sp.]
MKLDKMDNISPLATIFPTPEQVPESCRNPEAVEQRRYLCGGRLLSWTGPVREVWSPLHLAGPEGGEASLRPVRLGSYPLMGEAEAEAALAAALQAYDNGSGEWPLMPPSQRLARLELLATRMREVRAEVVRLLIWEIGKAHSEAEMEFSRTLDYLEATLAALREREEKAAEPVCCRGVICRGSRAPLGVALCLGPSNNPLYETFTILIPALLMGNTVIYKPPRLGVLLHGLLLPALQEVFPPGVINILYGDGEEVLLPLMRTGKIDLLAFIGSGRVADLLRRQHPQPRRLRCLLGLEAKNAAIILADADLEAAVAEVVLGALAFNGQRCTALKIILVEESIGRPFLEKLVRAVNELPGGMPWQSGVRITPLPEPARVDYLVELLADAVAKGARVLNRGGGEVCRTFMTPAVVHPVDPGMRLYHEEQFGPLVPVSFFRGTTEALAYVRQSQYGQQVSIFGRDQERIARLARPLLNQACRININSKCRRGPDSLPFTGRKNSAEGTVSVAEALDAFSIDTMVVARENEENRRLLAAIFQESSRR